MIFGSNVERLMLVVNEDVSRRKSRDKILFGCVWTLKNWKERKKLKNSFLFIVWFMESQKEKNREESCKENLSCYEEKNFLPNMSGK